MKKIKIIFDCSPSEELFDEDESTISEYSKSLSSLFVSGNIVILETSSCSLVLRPSKVTGIKVTEDLQQSGIKKEEIQDIITDQ